MSEGRDPQTLSDEQAGFARRLEPGRTPALLMVDFVRAYFEPGAQLYMGTDSCLRSGQRLLALARTAGVPIVHTRVEFAAGGADGGLFFRKVGALEHFAGGGRLGEIMPEVAPGEDEVVVVKQYASSFFGTSLASTLTAWGVDTVVLAGVSTSGCIRATAVDAIQHGFVPLVVEEAVGDRADGPHQANLFDIQAKYGEVLSEEVVTAYLQGLAR